MASKSKRIEIEEIEKSEEKTQKKLDKKQKKIDSMETIFMDY
jgi:hypothetical protein